MHVIMLCAGYATRLYPLTENCPKPLLKVAGRSILEWTFEGLSPCAGIQDVSIVSNAKFAPHFESWAAELKGKTPWPIHVLNDGTTSNENRLGAIGDLAYTLSERGIGKGDLLVIAGDNLFDFDMKAFMAFAVSKQPYPVLAVYDVRDRELAKRYGIVRTNAEGKVEELLEKPENPPSTLASCGIYWLPASTREFLDKYLAGGHNPDQPGHYMRWLTAQTCLYSVNLKGIWFDIGDLASYEKANQVYLQIKSQAK